MNQGPIGRPSSRRCCVSTRLVIVPWSTACTCTVLLKNTYGRRMTNSPAPGPPRGGPCSGNALYPARPPTAPGCTAAAPGRPSPTGQPFSQRLSHAAAALHAVDTKTLTLRPLSHCCDITLLCQILRPVSCAATCLRGKLVVAASRIACSYQQVDKGACLRSGIYLRGAGRKFITDLALLGTKRAPGQ